jgi:WD40 repeat protein
MNTEKHSTRSASSSAAVTASADGTARVWNAGTGQVIAKLECHFDWLNSAAFSAAFSPDGLRIITAGGDGIALTFKIVTLGGKSKAGHLALVRASGISQRARH